MDPESGKWGGGGYYKFTFQNMHQIAFVRRFCFVVFPEIITYETMKYLNLFVRKTALLQNLSYQFIEKVLLFSSLNLSLLNFFKSDFC